MGAWASSRLCSTVRAAVYFYQYKQPGFVKFYRIASESFLCICLRATRAADDVKGVIPCFVVRTSAEVDEWQTKLKNNSVSIEKAAGPGISSDGKHIPTLYNLFVRDPAGYLVEIQAFL